MDLDELPAEAIPLMEWTCGQLAGSAGLRRRAPSRRDSVPDATRTLERGGMRASRHNVAVLVSAARRLGLASLRVSFVEEVGQYMSIDLSAEAPLTVFVDVLEADIGELREQGHFVTSPPSRRSRRTSASETSRKRPRPSSRRSLGSDAVVPGFGARA